MKKSNQFFELLCLNSKTKIKKFLIESGKGPKSYCPFMFNPELIKNRVEEKGDKDE